MADANAYHNYYNGLLKAYASPVEKEGIKYIGIDYDGWAKDPRHKKAMMDLLGIDPEKIRSIEAKKSFWINAYNLLTIDMITRTGERETIKNQGDAMKSVGSTMKWKIGGKEYTLDQIKNDVLRPMKDPRVNFALNSGSISCPDIRREAYTASKLDAQLRDQVLVTFKNETKGIKFDGDTVRVPLYMEWVKSDFKEGNIKEWLKGYYPEHINADTEVGFFQHNWAINDIPQTTSQK